MTSIFCAISYIKNVTGSDKICHGSAVYRTGIEEFVEYKFKAFGFSETTLVEEVEKGSISMIIGRFVYITAEKELNVTIEQNTPLHVQTMNEFASIYDLPVSPAFGIFTAAVQDPSTPEGENAGRHASVAEATEKHPIFSVVGELVTLKNNACILCDVVEWTYTNQGNSKTMGDKNPTKSRKTRNQELEKLADKFDTLLNKKRSRSEKNETVKDPLEESSSRANRLRSVVNEIRGYEGDNDKTQRENRNETRNETHKEARNNVPEQPILVEDSTNQRHTRVEDYYDDQYTNEEKSDNSDVELEVTKPTTTRKQPKRTRK
ncbi:17994_t:CDS:2 [Gigaspora rosea]|nr:17994_t:CDS:2 [Gigaspora rosea]